MAVVLPARQKVAEVVDEVAVVDEVEEAVDHLTTKQIHRRL